MYSYLTNAKGCGCLLNVMKFSVFMQINYVGILQFKLIYAVILCIFQNQ